jgi:broad specificity phosphatase PhoE
LRFRGETVRRIFPIVMLLALALAAPTALAQTATTVILVRHAEKAAAPADDPPLTPAGEARARALLEVARDAGVSAVITTQFARTRATAQPLVAEMKLSPEVVDARSATHAQDVAGAVRKHDGQTVLVVGHSNTVGKIIEALGAKAPPPICDQDYDDLFIVTIPSSGEARLIHARYGAPAHAPERCEATK